MLGGESQSADLTQVIEMASVITIPLGLLREFVEVYLFVVALVITHFFVQRLSKQEPTLLLLALREALERSREMFWFTLKYMAITGISGGIAILLVSSPATSYRIHQIASSKGTLYTLGLVTEVCMAWLLLPSALCLLGIFAVSTSAAGLGLQFLLNRVETTLMIEHPWEDTTVGIVNTLLLSLPSVILFIALSLLALDWPIEKMSDVMEEDPDRESVWDRGGDAGFD